MDTAFSLNSEFTAGFEAMKVYANQDYDRFVTGMCNSLGTDPTTHSETYGLVLEFGKKFARIVKTRNGKSESSYGFVALVAGKTSKGLEYKVGDVFKAASYKAPALNFVRCNLLDQASFAGHVRWTSVS
jgi:hypothetical protein